MPQCPRVQLLRTMVHEFKIKLAQATQEKVEALMLAAGTGAQGAGGGGGGVAIPGSGQHGLSRRLSKDMSRSPGGLRRSVR